MDYKHRPNRIYLEDESGKMVAEITFFDCADGVNINHTYVDRALRGRGIAGELMEEVAKKLREENKKAIPTCPYAARWCQMHTEYSDILKQD